MKHCILIGQLIHQDAGWPRRMPLLRDVFKDFLMSYVRSKQSPLLVGLLLVSL